MEFLMVNCSPLYGGFEDSDGQQRLEIMECQKYLTLMGGSPKVVHVKDF